MHKLAAHSTSLRQISFSDFIIATTLLSLFLPGHQKSYMAISFAILAYILFTWNRHKSKLIAIYGFYVLFLILLGHFFLGGIRSVIFMLLIWLNPVFGVSLQNCKPNKLFEPELRRKIHIRNLSIIYLTLFIFSILNVDSSVQGIGWKFHNALLALIGTVLSMELLRDKKSGFKTIVMVLLLFIPILGALRQYVYIVIPAVYMLFRKNRLTVRSMYVFFATIVLIFALNYDVLVTQVFTSARGGGYTYNEFMNSATSMEEDNIQIRFEFWKDAVQRTNAKNFLIGHAFGYRFKPFGYETGAGMLHSLFASAYADGGIILLLLVMAIYLRYSKQRIKEKDGITLLIMYAYIIINSLNAWALSSQQGLIMYYIYGYYYNNKDLRIIDRH